LGSSTDNLSISVTSNPKGWTALLDATSFPLVAGGASVSTYLRVTVPSNATANENDNIGITVTSQGGAPSDTNYVIIRATARLRSSTDDTFVRQARPDEPQDQYKVESIYVGTFSGTGDNEYALLKFDLSGIPANNPISIARLNLYLYAVFNGPNENFNLYYVDNDNWDETNQTWNNHVGWDNDNLIDSQYFSFGSDSSQTIYADVFGTWDITKYAKYEHDNGDNILSMVLVPQDFVKNASLSIRTKQCNILDEQPFIDLGRAVSINANPSNRRAFAGGKFYYKVTVTNSNPTGLENYNLTVSDTSSWNPTLENSQFLNVPAGTDVTTYVYVTAPNGTPVGENLDNTTITVKSFDNYVSSSIIVKATVVDNLLQPPTDDAFVEQGFPDSNFGVDQNLWLQSFTENLKNERIFIKYDLRGLPPGQTISSAKLYFWLWAASNDDMDAQAYAVSNDSWSEENITWNNQPAYGALMDTLSLSSFPTTIENSWVSWDVTSFINGQYKYGDNFASFLIKAAVENTSGRYGLDSREFSRVAILSDSVNPRLAITFGSNHNGVSQSISPVHRIGDKGLTENFTVTIVNMGTATDTLTLQKTDNTQTWAVTIDNSLFSSVQPGESRSTTIHVAIPAGATPGAIDNIKIKASGTGVSDNENISVSVKQENNWVPAGYAPDIENYGVAVTGAGNYIYVATSNSYVTRANFMRYDPTAGGSWTFLAAPEVLRDNTVSTPIGYAYSGVASNFKNGTVLAWDKGNYIYALLGGAYSDNANSSDPYGARHYFFRYRIDNNRWENLENTGNRAGNDNLGAQGSGDAMVVVGGTIYAILGQKYSLSSFWSYTIATNSWTQLALPAAWSNKTDDGCALVWNGGNYLYAFQGSAVTYDNNFYRYSISGNSWAKMADVPAGVDDGGSLLWISGDSIFALLGGNPANQNIRANCFYVYSQSSDNWTKLQDLPLGIGDHNGQRMGNIGNLSIYVWRGPVTNPAPAVDFNPVLWLYTLPTTVAVTGTASIRLATGTPPSPPYLWGIRKVKVTTNLIVYTGDNLRIRFLAQDGVTPEGTENVIWSRSAPGAQTVTLTNLVVPHDNGSPYPTGQVKRVKLVLTDSAGNIILDNMAWFRAVQDDWGTRITWIILNWASHNSSQQDQLGSEISTIILNWASCPTVRDQGDFSQA
jgi:hypothetical protein